MFTITLGSIGWIAKLFSDPRLKQSPNAHFGSMLIVAAVCALAITIYARVSKTRFALRHYVKAWRFVRMKFYGKSYEELNRKLDVYYDRAVQTYFTGETVTTNWLIWAVIIGSLGYLMLGVFGGWPHFILRSVHRVVIAIVALSLLLFAVVVFSHVRRAEAKAMKDQYDDEPRPT